MKVTIKSADTAVPEREITPGDGDRVAIQPGDTIRFPDENPVAAVPQGEDLVVFFEDGTSVVLAGFFTFEEDETPPQIDLGGGKSFVASQAFQAADGLVIVFGEEAAGDVLGYEPFALGDLSGLGLNELAAAAVADFIGELGVVEPVDEIGELPVPTCFDGATITGAGTILGTACSETLLATQVSNNALHAYEGDDFLVVQGDEDVADNQFFGGDGSDSLFAASDAGDVERNLFDGGADSGNDTIVARAEAADEDVQENTLTGGAGDDSLFTRSRDDVEFNTLIGGEGDDTLRTLSDDDSLENSLLGGAGSDSLVAGAFDDAYDNTLVGGDGDDDIVAIAAEEVYENSLVGGGGADELLARSLMFDVTENTLEGDGGSDRLTLFADDGDVVRNSVSGGDDTGADTVFLSAAGIATGNQIDVGDGDDRVTVAAGMDVTLNRIIGGGGADTIRVDANSAGGVVSSNTLDGGEGDDRIEVELGPDQPVRDAIELNAIDGGADTAGDTLRLVGAGEIRGPGMATGIEVLDIANEDENLVELDPGEVSALTGGGGRLRLVGDSALDRVCLDEADWHEVAGAALGFKLYEDNAAGGTFLEVQADLVVLRPVGINTLLSGVAFDSLTVDGTLGDDTLAINGATPGVNTLNGAGGDDSLFVEATAQADLNLLRGDYGETHCTGDDTLVVSSSGSAQDNTLQGGGGRDSLLVSVTGGIAADNRLEAGAGPDDEVLAVFATAYNTDVTRNVLIGGDGADSLLVSTEGVFGYTTDNTLEGGAGDDTIVARTTQAEGQAIDNRIDGGAGDDSILVDAVDDADDHVVTGGEDEDMIIFRAGDDASGNSLHGGADGADDVLFIRAVEDVGANTLDGGGGNDSLRLESFTEDVIDNRLRGGAGAGDDTLAISALADDVARNVLDGGDGSDRLSISVAEDASLNSLFGGDGNGDDVLTIDAGGLAIANFLDGGAGADMVRVTSSADVRGSRLSGGAAAAGDTLTLQDDTLFVNAGTHAVFNVFDGGDGNDSLVVDAVDDASLNSLFGGEGNDRIAIRGGDTLNVNTLIGGEGDDSLAVLGDNDEILSNSLVGGAGRDTLFVDTDEDIIGNRMFGGDGGDSLRIDSYYSVYDNLLSGGDDAGDDRLSFLTDSIATGNTLLGGDGNDHLQFEINTVYQSIQETFDENTLDGGDGGADTLRIIADGDIDSPGEVKNIEALDVTNSGAANTIDLDTLEVRAITGADDSLTVFGDGPGDTVVVDSTQWGGPVDDGGFKVFEDKGGAGVFLLVQDGLTIDITSPGPPPGDDEGPESNGGDPGEEFAMALLASGTAAELDFEALLSSGSLAGGDAGAEEAAARIAIPVGAEQVLDVSRGVYAAAIAAVDSGDGTGVPAGGLEGIAVAGAAQTAAAREIVLPPVGAVSSLLDTDIPPDDGAAVV